MTTQQVNLLGKYNVGSSQENLTRSLCLIRVIYTKHAWSVLPIIKPALLFLLQPHCYESKLKGLSSETTLVLSNTRELDRVPSTK